MKTMFHIAEQNYYNLCSKGSKFFSYVGKQFQMDIIWKIYLWRDLCHRILLLELSC